MRADGHAISHIDIGGGLGVPSHPGEAQLDIAALEETLRKVKAAYPHYQLWMEPGRYLVADAGVLITRVTQQKGKGSWRYLGVDTGMNSLIRPALYDAWHEIVNLTRLDEPATALYQVVGPIATATEAAVRAKDGNFEAAVLDINLGDGAVYPIADMLAARGVPFVFVTGYDAESVDPRFRHVPILQKPIERDVLQRIFVVAAKAAVAG